MTPEAHETIKAICSAIVAVAALLQPIISSRKAVAERTALDEAERTRDERRFLFRILASIHGFSLALLIAVLLMGFSSSAGIMLVASLAYILTGIWVLTILGSNLMKD